MLNNGAQRGMKVKKSRKTLNRNNFILTNTVQYMVSQKGPEHDVSPIIQYSLFHISNKSIIEL